MGACSTKAQQDYKCKSEKLIPDPKPIQTVKQHQKYEYYEYQSPLDMIRKTPLIISGYIRKYKVVCPQDITQSIYIFYLIPISRYQIKTIGSNNNGQQGTGSYKNVTTLKTIKSYGKTLKNIINGYGNVYIVFTDSTYECCGYNNYGQLGINYHNSYDMNTFVQNTNIKINNIFTNPLSYHAFCIDNNNKIYACGYNYNNKWTEINTQIQIKKISTGDGYTTHYTTFINDNG
eukprot:128813_1